MDQPMKVPVVVGYRRSMSASLFPLLDLSNHQRFQLLTNAGTVSLEIHLTDDDAVQSESNYISA